MKIYFAGSIRGGREDQQLYAEIIALLRQGAIVLSEHIGRSDLSLEGEMDLTDQQIYQRDIAWIDQSDAIIAEVTRPSLGVGYEIRHAEAQGKHILCLWRPEVTLRPSAMIIGNNYQYIQCQPYQDIKSLEPIIQGFLLTIQ